MRPQYESTSIIPVCRQATTIEPPLQNRTLRITFSSFAEKAAQRQEKRPPANLSKPDKPLSPEPKEPDGSETIRLHKNEALEEAFEQRKKFAHDVTGQFWKDQQFFTSSTQKVFSVGTDCSGMEVPLIALEYLNVKFRHVFSSDNDKATANFIKANHPPEIFYDDITRRNNSKAPYVDIYIAGFPCQPFSIAGKRQGPADSQGRGLIFNYILDYITKRQPKIFILENVKGFTNLHNGKHMDKALSSLRGVLISGGEERSV